MFISDSLSIQSLSGTALLRLSRFCVYNHWRLSVVDQRLVSARFVVFDEPAVFFKKEILFARFDAAGIAYAGSSRFKRSRKAHIGDSLYLKAPSVIPVYAQGNYISVRVELSCYRYILLHISSYLSLFIFQLTYPKYPTGCITCSSLGLNDDRDLSSIRAAGRTQKEPNRLLSVSRERSSSLSLSLLLSSLSNES